MHQETFCENPTYILHYSHLHLPTPPPQRVASTVYCIVDLSVNNATMHLQSYFPITVFCGTWDLYRKKSFVIGHFPNSFDRFLFEYICTYLPTHRYWLSYSYMPLWCLHWATIPWDKRGVQGGIQENTKRRRGEMEWVWEAVFASHKIYNSIPDKSSRVFGMGGFHSFHTFSTTHIHKCVFAHAE